MDQVARRDSVRMGVQACVDTRMAMRLHHARIVVAATGVPAPGPQAARQVWVCDSPRVPSVALSCCSDGYESSESAVREHLPGEANRGQPAMGGGPETAHAMINRTDDLRQMGSDAIRLISLPRRGMSRPAEEHLKAEDLGTPRGMTVQDTCPAMLLHVVSQAMWLCAPLERSRPGRPLEDGSSSPFQEKIGAEGERQCLRM
jgi:hypothetical protein